MNLSSTLEMPVSTRKLIDQICDRFEAEWRAGKQPEIADLLAGVPESSRFPLFRELVALDREFRLEIGDLQEISDYRARFPEFADKLASSFVADHTTLRTSDTPRLPRGEIADALRATGYEVQGELGRGGMGIVFRARQIALDRAVAVKVIKSADFASEKELRRFQNEAESVARLDHPNIVPIYEVGESRGLPYFSMKLVPGASLDRRLDSFTSTPRASALLMVTVAEAVHHAHQRGILHRDLKPANILVDNEGSPHVTDFGLARPIDPDGNLHDSRPFAGTPAYMSPEQASGRSEALTVAVDVYGLGAVLYALLSGRAPHTGQSLTETLDRVREVQPQAPSQINPLVPRNLDVICLKALEKDAKHRYASAQELADDLNRWLSGRPITARPVGIPTRFMMWCRRHPVPTALSAMLVVSMICGFAGVTWKWREATRNATRSQALVNYLANRILAEGSTNVNPYGANLTVRQMLDRVASRIAGDFQGQPDIEAAIRETVAGAYHSLGEYAQAEDHWRKALLLDTEVYGPTHSATLHASNRLAATIATSGRVTEGERLLAENLQTCKRLLGNDAPVSLEAAELLGDLLRTQKRLDESEPLVRQALAVRRQVLPQDDPDTLRLVRMLSLLLVERNRLAEAETLALEYEHGIRCSSGPKSPENIVALANLGLIRRLRGQPKEAEPFYRRAVDESRRILGPTHPQTTAAEAEYAALLQELNREKR